MITNILVCVRIADLAVPYTEAQPTACSWCKEPVWVGDAVRRDVPDGIPVCQQCADELPENEGILVAPGPEARRAFRAWLESDRFHD